MGQIQYGLKLCEVSFQALGFSLPPWLIHWMTLFSPRFGGIIFVYQWAHLVNNIKCYKAKAATCCHCPKPSAQTFATNPVISWTFVIKGWFASIGLPSWFLLTHWACQQYVLTAICSLLNPAKSLACKMKGGKSTHYDGVMTGQIFIGGNCHECSDVICSLYPSVQGLLLAILPYLLCWNGYTWFMISLLNKRLVVYKSEILKLSDLCVA